MEEAFTPLYSLQIYTPYSLYKKNNYSLLLILDPNQGLMTVSFKICANKDLFLSDLIHKIAKIMNADEKNIIG